MAGILNYPTETMAAWNYSKTWTTKSDFETGTTLTNVAVSGDNDENDANNNDSISLTSQAEKRQTIAAGANFSLVIKTDGTLWATGYNEQGALGLGDYYYRNTWTQVPINDVISISASYHSLALKADGTVWGTGRNDGGQLGDGTATYRNSFVQTKIDSSTYLTNIKRIYASTLHSFAITNDNRVFVTGFNNYGQLGTGDKVNKLYWSEVTNFGGVTNFEVLDVAGGDRTSMVLIKNLSTNQNEIYAAGRNEYGELGLGDNLEHINWTLSPLSNVVDLEGSAWQYFAVVKSEAENFVVYSTGSNGSGRLGVGDSVNRNTWTLSTIDNVSDLFAGVNVTYAKRHDGTLWGTGGNSVGQLNLGDTNYRVSWVQAGFNDVTQVSASPVNETVLLLKQNGELLLIGYDAHDQSGLGESHYRTNIAQTDLMNATSVSAGYYTSYAIKNGYLYSTGLNSSYQGGMIDGYTRDRFSQTSINNVSKAVGGMYHLLVLKNDGTVWGIGQNSYGQLGVSSSTALSTTLQQAKTGASTFLTDVVDIDTAGNNSIALKSDGTVWAVGANNLCQLGIAGCVVPGTNQMYWSQVLTGVSRVRVGYDFSIALKTDGSLWGVGANTAGQLGLGNSVNQSTWQNSATGVLDFWVGVSNVFIKKSDGVYATGVNTNGQFGVGNLTSRNVFTKINTLDGLNIVKMGLGSSHSYALTSDGDCLAAGYNYYGQLGQGDFVREILWQPVSLTNVNDISNGYYHTIFKKSDGTVWSVGADTYAQLGLGVFPYKKLPATILSNTKQPSPFISTGTVLNLKVDAGAIVNWVDLLWSVAVPESTTFKVRTRGAPTEAELSLAEWSGWRSSSGDLVTTPNSQWLEVEVELASLDGAFTPILNSLTVNYYSDIEDPTNPTVIQAWKNSEKLEALSTDAWSNSNTFYAEWSGATDTGGSEVKGYWVYFGTDPTADPKAVGAFQLGTSFNATVNEADSGRTFYLCISAEDNAGNRFTATVEPLYKLFAYKFDKTRPDIDTANVVVSPVGWSVTNNFTFTWQDVNDPLSNGDASGVRGYRYKRKNGVDSWSEESTVKSATNIEAYQNGQNIFELKAIDLAGNESAVKEVSYYYNADAPTAPQDLTVTPQSSTENAFTFSWSEPASANGGVKGYYYSVNALPSRYNTVYITAQSTGLIAAATQQSFNNFYVVAMDNSDNINWGSFASIQFECNTPAPGSPTNPEIFDTSNRDLQKYSIALSWTEPTEKGAGFNGYVVERSLDGQAFSQVGTSAGTSYVDAGLQSQEYFYRLLSRDNSGNLSAPSTVVSATPTGRYTAAPGITVNPEVETKVSTASIRWVTDRGASSFVEIGETVDYGLTQGQFDFVTDHRVNIAGLKPNTIYHYRVKFVDEDGNIGYSLDNALKTQEAPRVVGLEISEVRLHTAYVTWETTAPAQASIKYGQNSNYSSILSDVSGGFTTSHAVLLKDLEHSSTYHLAILIKDIDNNEVLSDDYSFETQKYPVISMVRMEPVPGEATATMSFTWKTNVPTTSQIIYTPSGGKADEVVSGKLSLDHKLQINGLLDNNYYTVTIQGRDQFGNLATSDLQRFKTDYDTRAPQVSEVTSETEIVGYGVDAKGQIAITWHTDEPATSQVQFGIGSAGEYTNKSQEDAALSTSHVVIVSDLKSSSPYHFRVISRDASGNEGLSEDFTILTPQATRSIFDAILASLDGALGWLFNL